MIHVHNLARIEYSCCSQRIDPIPSPSMFSMNNKKEDGNKSSLLRLGLVMTILFCMVLLAAMVFLFGRLVVGNLFGGGLFCGKE